MIRSFFFTAALAVISATAFARAPLPFTSPKCEIKNVCYVLDQSSSISDDQYNLERQFVNKIADVVEKTSINDPFNAAVAFSTNVKTIHHGTENLQTFEAAVNGPRSFYGITHISLGLNRCLNILANKQGSRTIVLLTDGYPSGNDGTRTVDRANNIKDAGINLVTVGIGSGAKADFLRQLASKPQFYISTVFSDLDKKIQAVADSICGIEPPSNECERAYDECEFKFSGIDFKDALFSINGEPDMSITPRVVPKDTGFSLGTLNSNNAVPEFIDETGVTEITNEGSQRFTPTHFKPYWNSEDRASGVGHQTFHGNQLQKASGRCIRVFFTDFKEIYPNRQPVQRNNVPKSEHKCVVFRTKPLQ